MTPAGLSDLVGRIYDCALDLALCQTPPSAGRWPARTTCRRRRIRSRSMAARGSGAWSPPCCPWRTAGPTCGGGGTRGAAVLLQDPAAVAPGPSAALAALHGLTPAEARFLAALAAGRTVPEAAARLGVGEATGRTRMKRIFGKTGTARQPELIRLLAASAPPVRGGGH